MTRPNSAPAVHRALIDATRDQAPAAKRPVGWTAGGRVNRLPAGEGVYLFRQGEQSEILGCGRLVDGFIVDGAVFIEWDVVLDVCGALPRARLRELDPDRPWGHAYGSGKEVAEPWATQLDRAWTEHLAASARSRP